MHIWQKCVAPNWEIFIWSESRFHTCHYSQALMTNLLPHDTNTLKIVTSITLVKFWWGRTYMYFGREGALMGERGWGCYSWQLNVRMWLWWEFQSIIIPGMCTLHHNLGHDMIYSQFEVYFDDIQKAKPTIPYVVCHVLPKLMQCFTSNDLFLTLKIQGPTRLKQHTCILTNNLVSMSLWTSKRKHTACLYMQITRYSESSEIQIYIPGRK